MLVYKTEQFIEKSLRSALEQTFEDIEFVIVNDATPDGAMAVVERVLAEYPHRQPQVRIIDHPHNMGSAAARQTGIDNATGEYTIFLDSDDWVEPDMYEKMYDTAVREKADMVCCGFVLEFSGRSLPRIYPKDWDDKESLVMATHWEGLYSSLCNKLIRRSLYTDNEIAYYEGINMWEDLGAVIRLRYFSRRIVIMPDAFYHYNRLNEASIVAVPRSSSVENQIQCALNLERFFADRPDGEKYKLLIDNIKFRSKENMLIIKTLRDVARWKALFPETHGNIMNYTGLPFNARIEYWLAAHGMPRLACAVIDAKPAVKKLLRRK